MQERIEEIKYLMLPTVIVCRGEGEVGNFLNNFDTIQANAYILAAAFKLRLIDLNIVRKIRTDLLYALALKFDCVDLYQGYIDDFNLYFKRHFKIDLKGGSYNVN